MQEVIDEEQKPFDAKSEFEKKMIGKHRAVFSSTMDENHFLSGEEMSIKLKDLKACKNLYCYKPHPVPAGMRSEAKALIDNLEAAGIIRKVSETSETCAPASFVKKIKEG